MSGTAGILLLTGPPALGAPHSWTPCRPARGKGLRQCLNRRDGILAQRQTDGLLRMSVERLYVAGGLRLRERAKGEGFSRNGEIGNHWIDELEKYSDRRPPFVELAR